MKQCAKTRKYKNTTKVGLYYNYTMHIILSGTFQPGITEKQYITQVKQSKTIIIIIKGIVYPHLDLEHISHMCTLGLIQALHYSYYMYNN